MGAPAVHFYRITLAEARRSLFAGRAPSRRALQRIVDSGEWQGETVGGQTFIFVDRAGQPLRGASPQAGSTGNVDADAVLEQWTLSRK